MRKLIFYSVMACMLVFSAFGCKPDNAATNAGNKQTQTAAVSFAEITDAENRKVTLPKKPERVVVMVPSILKYVDAVGGTVVGRPSSTHESEIPASMKNVEDVGHVFNINMEKVVGLKPDLVFINAQLYQKFIKMLETNNINAIVLQPKTIEDTKKAIGIVGKAYGKAAEAEKLAKEMDAKIASTVAKIPKDQKKKIVILHATPSTVTVELENSIAGNVAQKLGFINVAQGSTAIQGKPEKAPYSIEVLVEKDPDIIFITSMGAKDKIEKRLKADVQGNPAYAALTAVKNNKVFILPEELFLLTPGLRYPEAVEYMAKDVFPETFK
ncbi:MAG: ABC transporter substrate-binding protein [Acidaminococcaceae bacterium]|nr:ABC transporter substrate-binding protein [Acidaminococcaceae bacterium]